VQTRLPWWALVLPAAAFVALLALITGGPAHASTPSVGVDTLGRIAAVLGPLVHHMP
jgi:hypothetical protein